MIRRSLCAGHGALAQIYRPGHAWHLSCGAREYGQTPGSASWRQEADHRPGGGGERQRYTSREHDYQAGRNNQHDARSPLSFRSAASGEQLNDHKPRRSNRVGVNYRPVVEVVNGPREPKQRPDRILQNGRTGASLDQERAVKLHAEYMETRRTQGMKTEPVTRELRSAVEELLWKPTDEIKQALQNYCTEHSIPPLPPQLLLKAVTHPTFCDNITGRELMEPRVLEWLGDRVLLFCASVWIFQSVYARVRQNPSFVPEVNPTTVFDFALENYKLTECAKALNLDRIVRVDKSRIASNSAAQGWLADAFEALTGALSLRHDLATCEAFLKKALRWKSQEDFDIDELRRSWKQELSQQLSLWTCSTSAAPSVRFQEVAGEAPSEAILELLNSTLPGAAPDKRVICVGAFVNDTCIAHGYGRSFASAESHAAQTATIFMGRTKTGSRKGKLRGVGFAWTSLKIISQLLHTTPPFISIQDSGTEHEPAWDVRIVFDGDKALQHSARHCSKSEAMEIAARKAVELLQTERQRKAAQANRASRARHARSSDQVRDAGVGGGASHNATLKAAVLRVTMNRERVVEWLSGIKDPERVTSKLDQILIEYEHFIQARNVSHSSEFDSDSHRGAQMSYFRQLFEHMGAALESFVVAQDLVRHVGLKRPVLNIYSRHTSLCSLDRCAIRAERVGFVLKSGDPGTEANARALKRAYTLFLGLVYLHCDHDAAVLVARRARNRNLADGFVVPLATAEDEIKDA
ncbi:Ribonuclease 3 [Porphyridium purpureum]|uniref:Ribonuclease 3 n=1 Tax=Porphyridium purpureum TaxID=35688 RepID=A0A5J4Z757_PORPP|nr:Ribonuclease 3 [Porphyridium purpureum]|eukprot:POR5830..scf295_1